MLIKCRTWKIQNFSPYIIIILRHRDMVDYIKYDSIMGYVGSCHGTTLVWVTLD